jgi:hypothetical protein
MAMRPTENIRDFFGRLNKVNTIILDVYQGYTLAPQDPVPDANGNITMMLADHQAYKKALVENVVEFYILNQFRAALLPALRRVINLKPMPTLDLERQFTWQRSNYAQRMRRRLPPITKPSIRKKKMTTLKQSCKIIRKNSTPSLSKIEVKKDAKFSDHKTTVTEIISNNGGTITPATTLTATR